MQINLVSVTGSNTPPTYGTTGARYLVVGSSPTTGSAFVNHAGELAETVGDGTYKFMGKAAMSQHTYVAGGVFYTYNGTAFLPLTPVVHSSTFVIADATATNATKVGLGSTAMTVGGIYVPAARTMHIVRVNGTITTGATLGSAYAGTFVVKKVNAGTTSTLASWSAIDNDTVVGVESTVAVDVAGLETVTVGWHNDTGSTGALANVTHQCTIGYYFTDS